MLTVKIANIPIGIDNRYEYIERISKDYLTDEPAMFLVSADDAEIERERSATDIECTGGYLESIVIYRKIAERLPEFDAVVFHGAVVSKGGRAYAFAARSGVGKTTHTRLWISELGADVRYINGDKPVIRIIDGIPYAFGTPWRGKEGYGANESAPLACIALLKRGENNSARRISPDESISDFIRQVYLPKTAEGAKLTMRVADRVVSSVRFVELICNMDAEAAHVAAEAMLDNE